MESCVCLGTVRNSGPGRSSRILIRNARHVLTGYGRMMAASAGLVVLDPKGCESRYMDREQFHRITKALADPRRYDILTRIASQDELACHDIRCQLPITAATLSHHIKELCNAGLIEVRKDTKFLHMKLRRKTWRQYLKRLERL